ncbi:MAG: DUF502 domain-containing protein [bacterium]|nr:DUF502 domain-containing protein [bacterium]
MSEKYITKLRSYFLTGLLVLIPLVVTVYVVSGAFNLLDSWLRDLIKVKDKPIPGLGFIVLILIILFTGLIAQNYFGRRLIKISESVMARIPLINKIYLATQQVSYAILTRKKKLFQQVVAIEYPRKGIYSVGFVTNMQTGEIEARVGEPMAFIFICTVPNPTSGFVIAVPKKDMIPLNMTVEEGLKLVISAGVVIPLVATQSQKVNAPITKPAEDSVAPKSI